MVSYKGLPLSIVHVTTREPPLTRLVFVHDRVPDGLRISRVPLFLKYLHTRLDTCLCWYRVAAAWSCSTVIAAGAKLVTYQA